MKSVSTLHLIVGLRIHAQTGMKPCGFLVMSSGHVSFPTGLIFFRVGACGPLGNGVGKRTKFGEHMLLAFTLRTLENIPREKCETLSE